MRASILIGLAIPASFLMGMLALSLWGFTINIVVLFSLILAVGMLVDDAIIVTEFAERRMNEGMPKREAFAMASHRMSGPVIAATMTRVAAFSPLLFWPGIVGEFMKYLPITLIVTLSASLVYALIFVPALGALIAKPFKHPPPQKDGAYMWVVGKAVRHPFIMLVLTIGVLVAVPVTYAYKGKGMEFFPNVEPEFGLLYVKARGNLSITEKDALVAQAEARILGWPGVATVYARTGAGGGTPPRRSVARSRRASKAQVSRATQKPAEFRNSANKGCQILGPRVNKRCPSFSNGGNRRKSALPPDAMNARCHSRE